MFGSRGQKARVLMLTLSNTKLKNWMKVSRDSLPKFAKAMALTEPDSLRVMLAAIDRHLKQNDSKISIAKDREFVKCRQVLEGKSRALCEKGHGKLKHLPSKMKSSYGKIVKLANKIQMFPVCPFNTTVQRRQPPPKR